MSQNVKIQKSYFSRMFHLLMHSMAANKPVHYVMLGYPYLMNDYQQAKRDFAHFWSRFAHEFPDFEYMCSIDQKPNGCWYINLLLFSVDSSCQLFPDEKLEDIWDNRMISQVLISKDILTRLLHPFSSLFFHFMLF